MNVLLLLQLLWSFTKIGFTSFGGLSMIPLISGEMAGHGWMTVHEVSDIVAIAEMTPGPLGLNCATFAGMRTAGLAGAIVANLGILMPTLTLTLLAAVFLERFKDSRVMQDIMSGVRPVCVGMIFGVALSLSQTNYAIDARPYLPYIVLGLVDIVLLLKVKLSIPKLIGLNALAGMLLFGVLGL